MPGSVQLATIFGIPIKVHWTFTFFLFWVIFIAQRMGLDLTGTVRLCGFTMVLFVCVILHELGHAQMAARFGVKTKDIIISPIGGIARLLKIPDRPREELLIALAGPAVNVVIAILLYTSLTLFTTQGVDIVGNPAKLIEVPSNFLPFLFLINIALVVFNMVPAFPMDGGRVLRALLSMKFGREAATRWAARLGHVLAIGFLIFGFWKSDFVLAFIGVFVMISASNEYRSIKREDQLTKGSVADVLRASFTMLNVHDPVSKAADLDEVGVERDFLVSDQWGILRGVLHREFIEEARKQSDLAAPIASYLSSHYETVGIDLNLKKLLLIFQEQGYSIVPVQQSGQMVGVVDRDSLNKFLQKTPKLWSFTRAQSKNTST